MEKAKAIETVFPETRHRLCNWQISKNATQHLASLCADPEFKKHFNKCFLDCFTEVEFQNSWDDMIKMFNLESNSWLKMLYSLREKWCPAFSLDTFLSKYWIKPEGAKSAQSLRLSELMHEGNNVFGIGSLCDSGTRIVRQKLAETIKLLESDEETTNMLGSLSKVDDQSVRDVLLDNEVWNPPVVMAKGQMLY
ncbi:hypothetical protein L3X38_039359 [Prunus dulcis]|uniref:Protein FAR1-RELATED SEQUENCE n=1 Tax=Prunus dulcis TaxID=3755 RepID=A0AAD4V957_PRUDU|nr:hypothetical protein L3X38_039359 [Prunus dulcis]